MKCSTHAVHPFTPADLRYFHSLGIPCDQAIDDYRSLVGGTTHLHLKRPCGEGDGILKLNANEQRRYATEFQDHADRGRAIKFVAASGAASRMFRSQISYSTVEVLTRCRLIDANAKGDKDAGELLQFFDNLHRFPFYRSLKSALAATGNAVEDLLAMGSYARILHCLLDPDALGYSIAPKGLIPFHCYSDRDIRSAYEEHVVEASAYIRDKEGKVRVHFTVPPGKESIVLEHLSNSAVNKIGNLKPVIDVSPQAKRTDAPALECNGSLVRDRDGNICLWPSGHGSLLQNLEALCGDIVFVRTIDNILPDRFQTDIAFHKQVLGGLLVSLQKRVFSYLEALQEHQCDEKELSQIEEWSKDTFHCSLPHEPGNLTPEDKSRLLFALLNRPLRICAMVQHRAEPGGGPFWIAGSGNEDSLQIVESAQVDPLSKMQQMIWKSSEYFNPADIVCGVRDYRGRPFHLPDYADSCAGFVSIKQFDGRSIRVLERPGLWNGSMAFWNTVFIEVPRTGCHPVKNVLDLLNPQHQP